MTTAKVIQLPGAALAPPVQTRINGRLPKTIGSLIRARRAKRDAECLPGGTFSKTADPSMVASSGWPFRRATPAQWWQLKDDQRAHIEGWILIFLRAGEK